MCIRDSATACRAAHRAAAFQGHHGRPQPLQYRSGQRVEEPRKPEAVSYTHLDVYKRQQLIETVPAAITCGFSDLALVGARLGALPGVQINDQAFTHAGAVLSVSVSKAEADDVARLVTDLTSGRATIDWNT